MATIFAVSSGALPAAIAVVRLSGPEAFATVAALTRAKLPEPRRAAVRVLRDPADDAVLDRALVLLFPGPASATGEDVAELHLHGGRAVVRAVEACLARQPGLQRAEAGAFTRRALLNGRIDLSEAEGLGDLLSAETEAQRRIAIRAAEGGVRRLVGGWTARVLALAAQVEAQLDHADEDDVAPHDLTALRDAAAALAGEMERVLDQPPVERLRDGLRVVLAGPPNAGKSTLFNCLAERDAAIVSPLAGTTRDRIEAPVVRGGVAYLLIDTAGLNEDTRDPIEALGIARSRDALAEADIVLWLGDAQPPEAGAVIWLRPRADTVREDDPNRLAVSARTGEGIAALWDRLADAAAGLLPNPDMTAFNERQRGLCAAAATALRAASEERDELLLADELRRARVALDRITGAADVEAMLDTLFARFCIGK